MHACSYWNIYSCSRVFMYVRIDLCFHLYLVAICVCMYWCMPYLHTGESRCVTHTVTLPFSLVATPAQPSKTAEYKVLSDSTNTIVLLHIHARIAAGQSYCRLDARATDLIGWCRLPLTPTSLSCICQSCSQVCVCPCFAINSIIVWNNWLIQSFLHRTWFLMHW